LSKATPLLPPVTPLLTPPLEPEAGSTMPFSCRCLPSASASAGVRLRQ
jgi:hypothetical protein